MPRSRHDLQSAGKQSKPRYNKWAWTPNLEGFFYSYLNYLWVVARLNLDSVDKHLVNVGSQRFVPVRGLDRFVPNESVFL